MRKITVKIKDGGSVETTVYEDVIDYSANFERDPFAIKIIQKGEATELTIPVNSLSLFAVKEMEE